MTYPNIAIAGKAGSGKTTIARQICEDDPSYKLLSLATPLKALVFDAFGIVKSDLGARDVFTAVGTALRHKDHRHWIDLCLAQVKEANTLGRPVVIDDCRLDDELEVLAEHDFLLCRLDAPTQVRFERVRDRGDDPSVVWSDHPTEIELDDETFHYIINTRHTSAARASSNLLHAVRYFRESTLGSLVR